jgi:hypothetical protein
MLHVLAYDCHLALQALTHLSPVWLVQLTKTRMLFSCAAAAAGEGAYGKVFEGLNKHTGELMAVKALQLLGRPDSEAVQTQLQELTQVRLCCIVRWCAAVSGLEVRNIVSCAHAT